MSKRTFLCSKCGWSKQQHSSLRAEVLCPICVIPATRQLPVLNGPSSVTEVVNKYTGTAWRQNQQEEVKQRRDEYYWSVEVPRLVNSGTYTMETMLENGWVWLDDSGQIHTHTRPPNAR